MVERKSERIEAEDPNFEILFNEKQIKERISEIATQISQDYKDDLDTPLLLIGVLKGATPFFIDLFREVQHPNLMMDYMGASSYGPNEVSSGKPRITLKNAIPVDDKNIIIIEDIVDTGHSLDTLINKLILPQNPKTLKICTLLSKPDRREIPIQIDYLGFEIPNIFVLGYGLDSQERGRNWPYIAFKK